MSDSTYAEIFQHISDAQISIKRFAKNITGQEVIIFVGSTRSGKSTLISYLIGNELVSFEADKRFYIHGTNDPLIQHGTLSCTSCPEIYSQNTRYLVDMPGFDDNRSINQNIVNTLFANQLKLASSVKFVLVCDIADVICDNVRNFTSATKTIQSALNLAKDCISVIFTKDRCAYTSDEIAQILLEKIGSPIRNDLIKYISKHPERIGIFRMPDKIGPLNVTHINHNVQAAISNAKPHIPSTIQFPLMEQSHCILLEIYCQILSSIDFESKLSAPIRPYKNYFTIEKYVYASTEKELSDTKQKLEAIMIELMIKRANDIQNTNALCNQIADSRFKFLWLMEDSMLLDISIKNRIIKNYTDTLTKLTCDVKRVIDKIKDEQDVRVKEMMQYIISEAKEGVYKFKVMSDRMIPILKGALFQLGYDLNKFSFAVQDIDMVCCLLGVGAAAAIATYGTHYYLRIHSRNKCRKEQGRD